jgi:hypothetical protein
MVISAIIVEISRFYPQDIARVKMANPAVSISLIKAKPSIRENLTDRTCAHHLE